MKSPNKTTILKMTSGLLLALLLGLIVGVLIGGGAPFFTADDAQAPATAYGKGEPLYWVAPMDPNYRRDQPGKSPMGMDLVPVYEEAGEPGVVSIDPVVVNNLGVRTAQVEVGELTLNLITVGNVQFNETLRVTINPRIEGWIEQLHVKAEGEPVTQGQPLYTVYSPALVNAQEELLLALSRNNSGLVDAASERLRSLGVSEAAVQKTKETRQVQQRITITSPQTGVVQDFAVREGAYIRPGEPLFSIVPTQEVWVIGDLYEQQLPLVDVGDEVSMSLDFIPGRQWQGQVEYIYPTLDPQSRTAPVRMRFDNSDGLLKPGMYAQLTIDAGVAEDVLSIPRQALIRTGNQDRVVLAKGEGRFKSVEVAVGRIHGDQVEVLSGLRAGDEIVTSAQFLLDSESSKASDFRRMDAGTGPTDMDSEMASDEAMGEPAILEPVWVQATVTAVMADHRMVTLHHAPVEEWEWPAMTMNFYVHESLPMSLFEQGLEMHVEMAPLEGGSYEIRRVHVPDEAQDASTKPELDNGGQSDSPSHEHMNHGTPQTEQQINHGDMRHD